jgi:transposase
MLSTDLRTTILHLHSQGHGTRTIARTLGISRNAVKRVLATGSSEIPTIERQEKAEEHLEEIRSLYVQCRGNLVRVWEELQASDVPLAYSTLTAFCRRHGIGVQPKKASGRYGFAPAEEMQHDTSPHEVCVGHGKRRLQCASVVLCHSRMLYAQAYPTFNRFYLKVFLTEALNYFGGAAGRCMVDNTSVVVAQGTGAGALIAPEMKAFADRFGFAFTAHTKGDANRSARVERPFHYIEHNFYAGRTFEDLEDLNRQMALWSETVNHRYKRHLHATPVELFQAERGYLKPLPLHIPEVYQLYRRIVDIEGYVCLHVNRYSAPAELIGRSVEVRESKDRVRIFNGQRLVAEHARMEEGARGRSTLPEHRHRGLWRDARRNELPSLPEEEALKAAGAELATLVEALKKKSQPGRSIRKLYRLFLDYPTEVLCSSVVTALAYGLIDPERIERIVLRRIAGEFFRLGPD